MKALIALLMVVHGLIHLLGFLAPLKLWSNKRFSGHMLIDLSPSLQQVVGSAWLVACLALLVAAGLELFDHRSWWVVAAASIALSQALIILQWPDAKSGTLANILIAAAVVSAATTARFQTQVHAEIAQLLAGSQHRVGPPVQPFELEHLPAPVKKWLNASGVVGKPRVHVVRLKQDGTMRLSSNSAWMPVNAEQYFDIAQPSFVWSVTTRWAKVIPFTGRDRYADGRGSMRIKAAGVITAANAQGAEIDQGSLLRFLGESVWFPSAALSTYTSWQAIDATHARATMTWGGISDSAVFAFDTTGRVIGLTASRYFASGSPRLEAWAISVREWKTFNGVEVPSQGDVTRKLADGDFTYYRWRITQLDYDVPQPFSEEQRIIPAPLALLQQPHQE